jgi:pimeloyl-ACP methyl ester carboxylesterase
MILIPGLSSSGETWDTTVARYRSRYTCHVLTLAGFAGVPPIDTPLLATVREELAAYVRMNRLERPVIVGHSLGGALALAMAIDHPDLVGPIVVVDMLPFLAGAQMQVKSVEDAQPAIAAMRAYFSKMTRAQYDQYVSAGTATKFMVASDADHDRVKGWSMASDPVTVGSAMADLYALDLREDIARITAPTMVLGTWRGLHEQLKQYGTNLSRADVVATFAAQFARLRPLRFVLSETARHFIMLDAPDWFFGELDGFLRDPVGSTIARGLPRD